MAEWAGTISYEVLTALGALSALLYWVRLVMDESLIRLLEIMADGRFYSGEALGKSWVLVERLFGKNCKFWATMVSTLDFS